MVNSCVLALWWSLSGTVCGTIYLECCPYFWLASACQNTTYSCCYSVASCIYFCTVSAVDALCAGGPFILLCLKGNSDDILGWYSYTWAIILQKYILYFPWMSFSAFLKTTCSCCGSTMKFFRFSWWIMFFMDTVSLWDSILDGKPLEIWEKFNFIHIVWAFCLYWSAYNYRQEIERYDSQQRQLIERPQYASWPLHHVEPLQTLEKARPALFPCS